MSVSEEAEPGGAETGFSLDISPWKQGGEERSPLSLTPALQARASAAAAAAAAAQKPSTAQEKQGRAVFLKKLKSPSWKCVGIHRAGGGKDGGLTEC